MEPVGMLFFGTILGMGIGATCLEEIQKRIKNQKQMRTYAVTPKRDNSRIITKGRLHEGWSEITTIH